MACVYLESNRRTRLIRITVWAAIIGLLLGVLSSLAMAMSADAHAALRSISPADGARLGQAPTQVVLTFDEMVSSSFATVTVTGPSGASVSQGRPRVDGAQVTQALAPGLEAGRYTVAFRVVSDDGHPVSDQTSFTILPTAATSSPAGSAGPTMTPLQTPSSSVAAAGDGAASSATPSEDDTTGKRVALAVGVGALALAAGTALLALSRRGKAT